MLDPSSNLVNVLHGVTVPNMAKSMISGIKSPIVIPTINDSVLLIALLLLWLVAYDDLTPDLLRASATACNSLLSRRCGLVRYFASPKTDHHVYY